MQRFCPKPFNTIEVHSDGTVGVCCHDWLPTVIGNLTTSSLDEVWNSDVAKSIRRSILDGSFQYCSRSRCPALVTGTLPKLNQSKAEKLHKICEVDSTEKLRLPTQLFLTYDPSCNLKCPSCRSDLIALDKEKRVQVNNIHNKIFNSSIGHAEEITLAGYGDPFSSLIYRNFLKTASKMSLGVIVGINTR